MQVAFRTGLTVYIFFFFFSQKIEFNQGGSLHEMLKWRILFSEENK